MEDRIHNISEVKLACHSDCSDIGIEDMVQISCLHDWKMITLWRNIEGGTKLGVQKRCRYSTWSNFETINILFKFKSSAKRIMSSHRHTLLLFNKHIRANVSSSKSSFLYYIMLNLKGLHLWKIKNPLLCRAVAKKNSCGQLFLLLCYF